jgi:hypothetical protein
MDMDLEQFLQGYSQLVLINLWDHSCEASLYMDQLLQELEPVVQVPVLRLRFAEHRHWAQPHGIYGTPAMIAYHEGRLLFRLIGRVTPDELLQRLRQIAP